MELRPYQSKGVQEIRAAFARGRRSVLYVLPTGGGKTATFAYIANAAAGKGKASMILVHRHELLLQASGALSRLDTPHGLISPQFHQAREHVQVASIQTLVRRLGSVSPPDLIITDECFPAGTIVGAKRIEDIKVGDLVPAFSDSTGEISLRRVLRTFKNPMPAVLVKISTATASITCTLEHPVFTGWGWKRASAITEGDYLYEMPLRENYGQGKFTMPGLLPRGDGGQESRHRSGADAPTKPDADRSGAIKNGRNAEADRPSTEGARRERARAHGSAGDAGHGSRQRMGNGVYSPNENGQSLGISNQLQAGYSEREGENRRGSGWRKPSFANAQGAGSEEGSISHWARVESAALIESGDPSGSEGERGEGFVYNLEVEDLNTYFANGIAVHNCHHSLAGSYREVFAAYPNARLLGVSATPIRTNGQGLGEIYEEMILGPSISELIAQGYLVQPEVYAPPVGLNMEGVRRKAGDFERKDLQDRLDRPTITGCAVEHYERICPGEPGIAFCVSVEHAEHVAASFRQRGIRAQRVDGAMRSDARRAAIDGLGSGQFQILTSADLIGEGVDVPRVSVAMLLRPTESVALYLQQVGRALRPFEGKARAIVLDHVGNVMRHGFPDDDRPWSLEGVTSTRFRIGSPPPVKLSQCEKCYFVFETGPDICPQCGYDDGGKARKIREEAGELERLTKEALAAAALAKKSARKEQGQAGTLQELIEIGKQRGYKNPVMWATQVHRNRKKGKK